MGGQGRGYLWVKQVVYSALSSLFCYESATIKPTMFNPKWTKEFKAMDKNEFTDYLMIQIWPQRISGSFCYES